MDERDYLAMNEEVAKDAIGWVSVKDSLPKAFNFVWISNGKYACLGCLIEDAQGSHWAKINGVIYVEIGEVVSECESEDLDVTYWHEIPKLPFNKIN